MFNIHKSGKIGQIVGKWEREPMNLKFLALYLTDCITLQSNRPIPEIGLLRLGFHFKVIAIKVLKENMLW